MSSKSSTSATAETTAISCIKAVWGAHASTDIIPVGLQRKLGPQVSATMQHTDYSGQLEDITVGSLVLVFNT